MSMSTNKPDIVAIIEDIRGRELSDEEAERILRVQHILNIRDNDALWGVIVALEHYQRMYEDIPPRVEAAGRVAVALVRETADAVAAAAAETAKQDLASELASSVREVANQTARKQQWQWITAGLVAAAVSTVAAGWTGFSRGQESGVAEGYHQAHTEAAAATWGASPEGRLGYRMANVGSLQQVARCTQPGWQVSDGVCYPYAAGDGKIYGWKLPQ